MSKQDGLRGPSCLLAVGIDSSGCLLHNPKKEGQQLSGIIYLAPLSPLPSDSGGRLRVLALWQALASCGRTNLLVVGDKAPVEFRRDLRNQAVSFYPPRLEGRREKLQRYLLGFLSPFGVQASRYFSRRRVSKLLETIRSLQPDLVVLGDTYLAQLLPEIKKVAPRVVVDVHNVESLLNKRAAITSRNLESRLKYWFLFLEATRCERKLREWQPEVWCVSPTDAEFYEQTLKLTNVHAVPNVVQVSKPSTKVANDSGVPVIAFTGWYAHGPNEDAALLLMDMSDRLLERGIRHAVWLIGKQPSTRMLERAELSPQVTITGYVEDAASYVCSADVVAVPLRAGSGTKLKIIEAMALERPVITTPIGAEGLDLEDGAAVVTDIADFPEQIAHLLSNEELRVKMGQKARRVVEEKYSQEALNRIVRDIISRV